MNVLPCDTFQDGCVQLKPSCEWGSWADRCALKWPVATLFLYYSNKLPLPHISSLFPRNLLFHLLSQLPWNKNWPFYVLNTVSSSYYANKINRMLLYLHNLGKCSISVHWKRWWFNPVPTNIFLIKCIISRGNALLFKSLGSVRVLLLLF